MTIELVLVGLAAGFVAGMLGVGGGVLIVPGLALFVGLSQIDAEATSLIAIVPTAIVGTWRQDHYGNVRRRDAVLIGVLSAGGAFGGVALANVIPERALELSFAGVIVLAAVRLARRGLAGE